MMRLCCRRIVYSSPLHEAGSPDTLSRIRPPSGGSIAFDELSTHVHVERLVEHELDDLDEPSERSTTFFTQYFWVPSNPKRDSDSSPRTGNIQLQAQ